MLVSAAVSALPDLVHADPAKRFGIFVQSDSRAELRPCHCPGKTINSLGRRSGVFKMARSLQYPVATLDGGDFFPDPDDSLREELSALMVEAMGVMRYDAVALGERDLLAGREWLKKIGAAVPLVCANVQAAPELEVEIPAVRWLELEDGRVAVTAYLDPLLFYAAPGAFDLYEDDLVLLDPAESLAALLERIRDEADLVVLIAHAALEEVDVLLEHLSGFDVVVQSHEPVDSHPGMAYDGTLLVIPEPRSREVSHLTVHLGDPDREPTARTWDLRQTRFEDRRLDALVKRFEERHGHP